MLSKEEGRYERGYSRRRNRIAPSSVDFITQQASASGRQVSHDRVWYRKTATGGNYRYASYYWQTISGLYTDFLGSGSNYGVQLTYRIQEKAGGIAEALELAKSYMEPGEKFTVLLGDNLFKEDLGPVIERFGQQPPGSARVLLKKVADAHRYGVPVFDPERYRRALRGLKKSRSIPSPDIV